MQVLTKFDFDYMELYEFWITFYRIWTHKMMRINFVLNLFQYTVRAG